MTDTRDHALELRALLTQAAADHGFDLDAPAPVYADRDESKAIAQRQLAARLAVHGVSVRHAEALAKGGYIDTPAILVARRIADRHVHGVGVFVWICGAHGVGKSFAAASLLLGATDGRVITGADLVRQGLWIREGVSAASGCSAEILRRCSLLVIDDAGQEEASDRDYTTAAIDTLVEARLRAGLTTVITSNHTGADAIRGYLGGRAARVLERLVESGGVQVIAGENLRRRPARGV